MRRSDAARAAAVARSRTQTRVFSRVQRRKHSDGPPNANAKPAPAKCSMPRALQPRAARRGSSRSPLTAFARASPPLASSGAACCRQFAAVLFAPRSGRQALDHTPKCRRWPSKADAQLTSIEAKNSLEICSSQIARSTSPIVVSPSAAVDEQASSAASGSKSTLKGSIVGS